MYVKLLGKSLYIIYIYLKECESNSRWWPFGTGWSWSPPGALLLFWEAAGKDCVSLGVCVTSPASPTPYPGPRKDKDPDLPSQAPGCLSRQERNASFCWGSTVCLHWAASRALGCFPSSQQTCAVLLSFLFLHLKNELIICAGSKSWLKDGVWVKTWVHVCPSLLFFLPLHSHPR